MKEVYVYHDTAITIPKPPNALQYNNNYIQIVGPFLLVTNNNNCSVTPLSAKSVITLGNKTGCVVYNNNSWVLVLNNVSVQIPSKVGSLSVATDNEVETITTSSNTEYEQRWATVQKQKATNMSVTVTNVFARMMSGKFNSVYELVDDLCFTFGKEAQTIAEFVFLLKYGPAFVIPTAQCVAIAKGAGVTPNVQKSVKRQAGFVYIGDNKTFTTTKMKNYNANGVMVGGVPKLPPNIIWKKEEELDYIVPVLPRDNNSNIREVTATDMIVKAREVKQPQFYYSQFLLKDACSAFDAKRLVWGVDAHVLPLALKLLTRKSEKNQPSFLTTFGYKNSRDLTFVSHMLSKLNNWPKSNVKNKIVLLSMRRGHSCDKALQHLNHSLGFEPFVLFRAPRSKVAYDHNTSTWKTDISLLQSATVKTQSNYVEPATLLFRNSKYWHGNALLRNWTGGAKPTFDLVWEPKIDGWRILLHWNGVDVLWQSNTGRNITSLIPADVKDLTSRGCARCKPFILDCELVVGDIKFCEAEHFKKIPYTDTLHNIPYRTRASEVTSKTGTHTLFILDCLVANNIDISNLPYSERIKKAHRIHTDMRRMGNFIRFVPQIPINNKERGKLSKTFVKEMCVAMLNSGLEGIVIKCTGLVYGAKHCVLKPIYFLTRKKTYPFDDFNIWNHFWCYCDVVYLGYIETDRDPWCLPIFGIQSNADNYRKSHPWHGYIPVHLEGYKVAYNMMRLANGKRQPHVQESVYVSTPWFSVSQRSSTGCQRFLHPVTQASPRIRLVAEMIYKRKNTLGWSFPYRLYLTQAIDKSIDSIDSEKSFLERIESRI